MGRSGAALCRLTPPMCGVVSGGARRLLLSVYDWDKDSTHDPGFVITRGYGGYWVFEALLEGAWVWVFAGMGTCNISSKPPRVSVGMLPQASY